MLIETYKTLQAKWAALFPEIPFDGGMQEDVWGNYYEANEIYGIVWTVFAFLAVSLASLGLYGLVTLNVSGRVKEFSIRKVLGADLKNIAASVSNQYLILFTVALFIGAPTGFLLGSQLLVSAFAYHMPIGFSGVIIGTTILACILLTTVATQVRKVSKDNPVNGLNVE